MDLRDTSLGQGAGAGSRKRYCTFCGGELFTASLKLPSNKGELDTSHHLDKGTCIGILNKRVFELQLELSGVGLGNIHLDRRESLALIGALVKFFPLLGMSFGKAPAIVLGLLGKKAGITAFMQARTLTDEEVISLIDEWLARVRAVEESMAKDDQQPAPEPEQEAGVNGINPDYPPPGEDPTLDYMRAQGLPDPGTPAVQEWVREHIEGEEAPSGEAE